MMKVPKNILRKILEMEDGKQSLSKFNHDTGKWDDVIFDPNNDTHLQIKETHLAEVEVMCIIEALRMGLVGKRELD